MAQQGLTNTFTQAPIRRDCLITLFSHTFLPLITHFIFPGPHWLHISYFVSHTRCLCNNLSRMPAEENVFFASTLRHLSNFADFTSSPAHAVLTEGVNTRTFFMWESMNSSKSCFSLESIVISFSVVVIFDSKLCSSVQQFNFLSLGSLIMIPSENVLQSRTPFSIAYQSIRI